MGEPPARIERGPLAKPALVAARRSHAAGRRRCPTATAAVLRPGQAAARTPAARAFDRLRSATVDLPRTPARSAPARRSAPSTCRSNSHLSEQLGPLADGKNDRTAAGPEPAMPDKAYLRVELLTTDAEHYLPGGNLCSPAHPAIINSWPRRRRRQRYDLGGHAPRLRYTASALTRTITDLGHAGLAAASRPGERALFGTDLVGPVRGGDGWRSP